MEKNLSLAGRAAGLPSRHFASFSTGTIDYTPHHEKILILIEAMNATKICRITYQAIMEKKAKTYHIKPLKIFSYRDTVYLHARMAIEPGKAYREPDFDPLLAIHRLKKVEKTTRSFEYPADYKFEDVFDKNFGFMKDDCFEVVVEFTGWAADYVAERTWSPDQKIVHKRDGNIKLIFSASSEPEVVSWVLSFGDEAKVIRPKRLKDKIKSVIQVLGEKYN